MIPRFSKLLPLLIVVAGCASTPPLQTRDGLTVVAADTLPPPSAVTPISPDRVYRIGALDKLQIDVFNIPDLSREVQVDTGGRVVLPLIGEQQAAGLTPAELSQRVEAALRAQYVRRPQVSVGVKETNSQLVTVDGEVRDPGTYPIVGQMTLVRAVAAAKGTTEFSKLEDVVVFRTVDGRKMAAMYNLGAIRRGVYDDPVIYSNDLVVVGDSPGRRMIKNLLPVASALVTPIVVLLQR